MWDPADYGVVGFGFDIDELPDDGEVRFRAIVDGEYCASIDTSGEQRILLADLMKDCWLGEGNAPDGVIEALEWRVVPNESTDYSFGFCIGQLVALTQSDDQ
jgi:hypothetical protein